MSLFKCKMCGGNLELTEGSFIATCEYCGTTQTVPSADNEKKLTLFGRANRLRAACEFDKAFGVYEAIVADFPEEAEAYWGLVLCKYGIEYVDDPKTGKKIPTCHRSSFESVMDDANFEQVLENSDVLSRNIYREEAKQIEELRKEIIEISAKEAPYDIFICYKETDNNGNRTIDSVIAQDVYDELTEKGYRVFFSRITLEDKLGQEYEPYIFAALNSAKVMLAFGTDYEYYNAVWVKNEWNRYLELIAKGEKKTLIPCYKNIDAYDMPKEFAKLQAQDMGKVGAIQDLIRGIGKIISSEKTAKVEAEPAQNINETVEALIKEREEKRAQQEKQKRKRRTKRMLQCTVATALFLLIAWTAVTLIVPEVMKLRADDLIENEKYQAAAEALRSLKAYQQSTSSLDFFEIYEKLDERLGAEVEQKAKNLYRSGKASAARDITAAIDLPISKAYGFATNGEYQSAIDAGLTEIVLPDGTTSIDDSAFDGCSALTSITIPDSVTSIGDSAFDGCSALTSIPIPDSVTSIGDSAFDGCSALTSITIPDSVTSIGDNVFNNCTGLADITIPDGVTSIGDSAFDGCSRLTSITIPDSVTSIGSSAFSGCSGLASITIPDSVTSIGDNVFNNCTGLADITIPDSVIKVGTSAFSGCSGLNITILDGVTSIGDSAFSGCSALTSITIPDSVTSIGASAFYGCSRLTSIAIPSSVTSIGDHAFRNCTALTSITIPDGVTSTGNYVFYGCSGLTSITIPDSVTSIGSYAFSRCSCLTGITISDSVISIGNHAFSYCADLTSITIPDSVTSIGDSAFDGCSALTSIIIPDSVTSIGTYAFRNCTSLTSITIPDSVTSIGTYAFSSCSGLTSITIPNSVTSIGTYAFCGCTALTNITIPDSVTRIGMQAFLNCSGLKRVTFKNTVGWKAGTTKLSGSSLGNTSKAAKYLTDTYRASVWKRG